MAGGGKEFALGQIGPLRIRFGRAQGILDRPALRDLLRKLLIQLGQCGCALGDPPLQPIPIGLATPRGQHAIEPTTTTAGSFLSLLPTVIFFLIFQRTLSNGVTAGAIK